MSPIRFLDAHHHLWDLNRNSYPWLQGELVQAHFSDYSAIRKNYLPTDFAADSASVDLVASVHVEAGIGPGLQLDESSWLTEMCRSCHIPNAAGAKVALDDNKVEALLEEQSELDLIRGVRDMLFPPGNLNSTAKVSDSKLSNPRWRQGFTHLSKYKLSFDLQAPPFSMSAVAYMLAKFPQTKVALTHCGLPLDRSEEGKDLWRRGMKKLTELPNVQVKISGLPMTDWKWTEESLRPWVLDTIEFFGPKRCMFGSNFPVDGLFSDYTTLISAYARIIKEFPRWNVNSCSLVMRQIFIVSRTWNEHANILRSKQCRHY
jgi:predicted TIM-barrel fold metal-dependent hydrolase